MSKRKNLTGMKFGRLTVLELVGNHKNGKLQWKCICECGNIVLTDCNSLTSGNTKSCGCFAKELLAKRNMKHGFCKDKKIRIYNIWIRMKQRCSNANCREYKDYGGRGIRVCDEWIHDFPNFKNWAVNNGYSSNLTIDRIDVDKGYNPKNCRWTTNDVQAVNKRSNHYVNYKGETKTISEWSRITGIKQATLRMRLKHGWSVENALNISVGGNNSGKYKIKQN